MAKGASSGISFDEYMRKKKEEEETKKEEPKKSTSSTDKKLSEPTNKSGKTFGESVYENYTSKNVNADSLKKWFTEAESTIKSTQDYVSKNQFDKYNTDYGSEYSSKVGELLDSYDAVSAFVKYNKDGFEDYDSISNALDQYTKYLREFNSHASSTRDYYSQWESEDDFKNALTAQAEYEDLSTLDLDALKKDVDHYQTQVDNVKNLEHMIGELDAEINTYKYASNFSADARAKLAELENRKSIWVQKLQEAKAEGYDKSLSDLTQRYNRAKHIQTGIQLTNDALGAKDFAEKSGYVSTKKDDFWSRLTGNEYDDTYEYINDVDGMRSEIEHKRDVYQSGNHWADNTSTWEEKGYDLLTDEEVAIYNYYYSTEGKEKAEEYLASIQETLYNRRANEMFAEMEGKVFLEYIFGVEAGPDQFASGMANAFNFKDDYIPVNATQQASGMVREDLADKGFNVLGSSIGQIGYDAVTTTSNMLPSILASTAVNFVAPGSGAVLGAGLMGTSASGSAYQEMLNLGYDKGQARTYSTLVGISEAGLQYALGGVGKLGGKLTNNAISKVIDGIDNGLARFAIDFGGSVISEGIEEGLQEVINPLLKNAIFHTDEDVDWSQVAYSALLGSLSAFGMEGVGSVASHAQYNSAVNAEGNRIVNEGGVDSLVALANEMSGAGGIDLSKRVGKINGKKGVNVKAVGNLSMAMNDAIVQQNNADIVKALEGRGISSSNAQKYADILASNNYELGTVEEWQKATGDTKSYNVIRSVMDSSVNTRNAKYGYARNGVNVAEDGTLSFTEQRAKKTEQQILKADYAEKADAVKAKVSENGTAKVIKTDTEVTLKGIDHIETVEKDGKEVDVAYLKVADADGNESVVEWGDVEFSSRNEAVLYETFVGMDIDPVHFDAFVKNFNEADFDGSIGEAAVQYAIGFRNAYRYGWANMETELGGDVFASKLTESVRNTAYTLGRETVTKQTEAKQKALDTAVAERKASGKGKAKSKGKLHMEGVKTTKRTAMQNAGVGLAKRLTDLGIDVYVYESRKVNGQWVDENGNVAPNGYYRAKDGSIHIDLNAGEYGQGIMVYTLAHELTHFMRDKSPKQFKAFADLLVKWYGEKGETLNGLITKTMNDENLSWDDAYEEVIARSCESFLTDSNIADRILELQNTDKGLWETIRDKVLEFLKWMKSLFANVNPESYEGDLLHQYKSEIDHLYDAFYNTLADAVETNQWAGSIAEAKTNAETLATAGITVDANTGSAVMNSVRYAPKTQAEIDKVAKALSESMGVSIEKAKAWVKSETSLASVILDPSNAMFLDYEADDRYEAIKKNAEYPQGTVDFSNLCKKRREFTALLDKLQKEHPNRIITAEEMEKIRQILIEENVEVACGLCYVEERRQLLGEIAQGFIDGYKNGTLKENIAKELDGNDTYVPTIYDLITYDGYRALATEHPSIAEAFKKFNNARGMQAGRLIEGIAEYKRDILNWSQKKVDFVNSVGGLRVFSFSDFEATHLIDLVQVVQDCAAKGVMIQAYTKVPAFANAVKDTNIKVNRSLIANGTGIKYENGRMVLDLDPVEGININDKDFFDSTNSESVGNVLVGMSDEQIRLAMKTPFVDYIIPFHTGLKKDILKAKKIDHWDNYKNFQTDKDIATGKVAKNQINVYVDVIQAAEAEGKPIKNKVDFVNKFLAVAKEKGLKPRFWNFLDVDANGEYTYTEGYHKFLVDFKLFDQQGNILPQKPVVPEFDDALNARILNEYVAGKKAPVSRDAVYDRLEREVIDGERISGDVSLADADIKHSLRKSAPPKKTVEVYKLMRLKDGKIYPLFIDSTESLDVGTWYDADSPNLDFLKQMPSGIFLVDTDNESYTTFDEYLSKSGEKRTKFPSKKAIEQAAADGTRWVYIEDVGRGQKRFGGETRKYWNLGINGSGAVSTFSMRPGYHAGSLPSMRQIGKGANKDLRDDSFVWTIGEVPADIDYQAEANRNPDKDIPTHIPVNGYYLKATNADKAKSQADVIGWYVAGSYKINRIISDSEARQIIDDWNAKHPNAQAQYDYDRESGMDFDADSMTLVPRETGIKKSARKSGLATYTEAQYNAFGWASYNGIITANERETLLSRFADFKHNRHKYPVTRWGEAVIHSTECPDVIMYVRASSAIDVPEITRVVKIKADDSVDTFAIRERIIGDEEEQVLSPYESVTTYFGEEVLEFHRKRDNASFQEYLSREEGRDGKGSVSDSKGLQNREGSIRENLQGNRADGHRVKKSSRRVSAEQDAQYLELAKDPVKNAKQLDKMVEDAAKVAFPNSRLLQGGKFHKMWHHTNSSFNSFLPGTSASSGRLRGIYFTPQEHSTMSKLGSIHKAFYLNVENLKFAFGVPSDKVYVDKLREMQEGVTDRNEIAKINRKFKEETGVDAFFDWQNGWYNILTPEQIKSADPVTYDEQGNVVPLSKRFDSSNDDIRYSKRQKAPTFYSYMGVVVDGVKQEKLGAASVINMLKGKGVKDEEIKWSGIETWLEGKKSVTKAELQAFIAGSQLQIGEQMSSINQEAYDALDALWQEHMGSPLSATFSEDFDHPLTPDGIVDAVAWSEMEGYDVPTDDVVRHMVDLAKVVGEGGRWSNYKLDGGTNYREIVFTMPNSTYFNDAMQGHWGQDAEGVLAHARIQDFTDADGNKMLFVEEIQSDWHNEGAKKGYSDDENRRRLKVLDEKASKAFFALEDYSTELTGNAGEYDAVEETAKGSALLQEYYRARDAVKDAEQALIHSIPDAPFRNTYHEFVLKRLIRMAAEEGYDSIGWTTAQIQSERWSDKYAEGYRIEYDQDIPKFLRKYGKKWGATVGKTNISTKRLSMEEDIDNAFIDDMLTEAERQGESGTYSVWSMPITDSMKDSVLYEGQVMYQQRGTGMSNRSLLANALSDATQNDSEARRLEEYKAKIDLINSEEQKLQETRARIAELSFASGPKDTTAIKNLQDTATRIANRINTYDKQLLNLEATAPLKALLEREKSMARKREKEKAADALAKYREKSAETIREVMTRNTESRKKSIDSRKRTVVRNKIKRVVTDLNGLLNRGTKERNVKTDMQETVGSALKLANVLFNDEITNEDIVLMGSTMATEEEQKLLDQYVNLIKKRDSAPVGEAMRYINKMSDLNRKLADLFKRERARLNQAKVSEAVDELAKAYANLKVSDKDYVNAYYSEEAHKRLLNLSESLGGTVMKDMSIDQLEEVYDAYKMIRHIVRESNSLFRMGKTQDLAKTVTSVQGQILSLYKEREKDPRASAKKIGDFLKNFAWNEMKPLTAFETLGADAYTELFWDAIKAEGEWAKWMEEANAFLDEQRSKFNYKSWDMDTAHEFTLPDGKVFRLTLQEMLSIYAYSKREQAQEHMTIGGFQFDKHNVYKDNDKKKRVRLGDLYVTDWSTIGNIIGSLTDEQKHYADAVQKYLTDMGQRGNEVSEILYGIGIFNETAYFPLMSAKDYRSSVEEALNNTQTQVSLKNTGMTKQTVPHASNPIILQRFDDVAIGHIDKMAKYCTQVLAIENLRRVFDSVSADDNGGYASTKAVIEKVFGESAKKYFDQYITDLNGGTFTDGAENPWMTMFSKFKGTAVGASLSVVVQQPMAVIRAMDVINAKHFIGGVSKAETEKLYDEIKRYAPVAILKEMGGFDVGSSRTARDYLGVRTDKGFNRAVDEVNDIAMWGAGKADQLGWGIIWKAVKREVASNNEFKPGTAEFLEACGERFTEVIVRTQVYDSVNSRSGYMRSKRDSVKYATSFMGEPTTVINEAYLSMLKLSRANGKQAKKQAVGKLGRTMGVLVTSTLLTTLAKSLVYAMRDKEDDEALLERWAKQFADNSKSDINPLNMFPFARDIVSIFEGWDVERPDMTLIAKTITSAKRFLDRDNEKQFTNIDEVIAFIGDTANMFGLPVKNVIRDAKGIINAFGDIFDDVKPTDMGGAFISGLTGEEKAKTDALYDAIVNGDTGKVDAIKKGYKDDKAVESAIRKSLRENDPRIKEAAKARYEGDVAEYMRIVREIKAEGHFSQDTIVSAINTEISELKPKEESKPSSPAFVTSTDYYNAIVSGQSSTAESIKNDLIAEKVADGDTQDDAEDSVVSGLVSQVSNAYKDGELSRSSAESILSKHCDKDADEIYWTLDKWDYSKQNGSTDGYSKYGEFHTAVETGKNLKATIKRYTDHGVEAKTLASQITSYFKPLYKEMSNTERANIKGYLLNAYTLLGYNRFDKSKDIDAWLKD